MLPRLPAGLLHGLLPFEGPVELILEVALYLGLLASALALVLLFDTWEDRATRAKGTATVLLLPVLGAIVMIARAYRARSAHPKG